MRHIYTSLDIGSDTIKIIVCELFENRLNLLAASSYKSKGIKKGLITDVTLAGNSIKEAIKEVEDMLDIKITKVIASVPSYFADYSIVKGSCNIKNTDGIVTNNDIIKSLENAIKTYESTNKEMVTILPIDYKLDNNVYDKLPLGESGSVLESRGVIVTTPRKNIYSVITLLESLCLEVVDISINNIGDLYAFSNKEFDDKIGAIINIGSQITNISLYNKNVLVKSAVIDQGGSNIDSDLAYMYKIDKKEAKKIKMKFALAHKKRASIGDVIEVKSTYEERLKINQYEFSEIVMSRIEEILNMAKKELNLLTSRKIDYIIITGGTSNMPDFEYVVNDIFGKNASIGNIKMLGIRNNKYSSCIGNIVYFISKLKLKGKDYTMISDEEANNMSNSKKINTSDSMLGKIFGYFFSE